MIAGRAPGGAVFADDEAAAAFWGTFGPLIWDRFSRLSKEGREPVQLLVMGLRASAAAVSGSGAGSDAGTPERQVGGVVVRSGRELSAQQAADLFEVSDRAVRKMCQPGGALADGARQDGARRWWIHEDVVAAELDRRGAA